MAIPLPTLSIVALVTVLIGWGFFGYAVFGRPRAAATPESGRDRTSILAIIVQGAGFGLVWGWRRPPGTLFTPPSWPAYGCLIVTALLAWGAAAFAVSAIRTLGRQWSLTARVLSTHHLITTGPYSVVRHPIYTSMLGLLLATGLALSTWQAVAIGAVVFLVGTAWRVRLEERLLLAAFGEEFERYRAKVPAFIPYWRAG